MDNAEKESLTERLEKAVHQAEFTNMGGDRFESSKMQKLYVEKCVEDYALRSTDDISVRKAELTALVSELQPMLKDYISLQTGDLGNGLSLAGASPQFPSIEDYAKILVLAATRLGSERVVEMFTGWLDGRPLLVSQCSLLTGVITDGQTKTMDGLSLETLPKNKDDFPRPLSFSLDVSYYNSLERTMLCIEYAIGPALCSPDTDKQLLIDPPPWIPTNPKLCSESIPMTRRGSRPLNLRRAISLEINHYVGWYHPWDDYGDVDAFLHYNLGSSIVHWPTKLQPSPARISGEQWQRCLKVYEQLDKFKEKDKEKLNLGIDRWLKSKEATQREDQLIELRIALEVLLLAGVGDKRTVGELTYRLAMRGAWLLGATYEKRKEHFESLRDVYHFASSVLHAGNLGKLKKGEIKKLNEVLPGAQDLCREAILRIAKKGTMPNWSEVVLGKESVREKEK